LVLITATGQDGTFLLVGQSLATVNQAVREVTMAVSAGGVLAVLATAVAGWFLAGRALAPVECMRREAARISERDNDTALSVPPSNDELARLAVTLNDLLGRLHTALERERGFSAAASHELRSPLAVLRAELQLAGRPGRSPEYLSAAVRRATGEVDRVIDLANRLLLMAQGDADAVHLETAPVNLTDLVQDTLSSQSQKLDAAGVSVSLHAPDAVTARVDVVAYRRIVDNLVENALRHGGPVHRLDVALFLECKEVRLEIADDGSGFPPKFLPHAFERFSRADPSRSRQSGGAGLGLSIVATLARAHGGRVQAANRVGGGAIVRVWIPVAHAAEMEPSPTRDPTSAVANGHLGVGEASLPDAWHSMTAKSGVPRTGPGHLFGEPASGSPPGADCQAR
jgi:signal transduction histidine kinase